MVSSWYMPYRKSVQIRLTNSSGQAVTILGAMSFDREPPPESSLYFHARWRYQDGLRPRRPTGPWTGPRCAFRERPAALSACS